MKPKISFTLKIRKPRNPVVSTLMKHHSVHFKDRRREANWGTEDWGEGEKNEPMQFRSWKSHGS